MEGIRQVHGNSSGVLANSKYGLEPTTAEANAIHHPILGIVNTKVMASTVQGDEQSTAGPYIAHLESQYSWAHMDPSAHSLAFRGGAEVPEQV